MVREERASEGEKGHLPFFSSMQHKHSKFLLLVAAIKTVNTEYPLSSHAWCVFLCSARSIRRLLKLPFSFEFYFPIGKFSFSSFFLPERFQFSWLKILTICCLFLLLVLRRAKMTGSRTVVHYIRPV